MTRRASVVAGLAACLAAWLLAAGQGGGAEGPGPSASQPAGGGAAKADRTSTQPAPGEVGEVRKGPLATLPSEPGPQVDKIKALGDDAWINLGSPAPDPKWGKARGRAWTAHLAYAPELQAAFLMGEGVHAWFNKETNRYMDDLFVYDLNAHRWICVHPGTDIKNVSLKQDANGFEVDDGGQPVPVAQLSHGFEQVTYDPDGRKFMFMPRPTTNWLYIFGERRKDWGGYYQYPYAPRQASPWMYNSLTGRFELLKAKGPAPGYGSADVAICIPGAKKLFYWHGGGDVSLYDIQANTWTTVSAKGPPPPFGCDPSACLDPKRQRIYLGGGYYPVAQGPNGLWCYDLKTNEWVDLKPKGLTCRGCNRYGPNNAIMNYDSVNDAVVLFYHRGPVAEADGKIDPGPEARAVYVYDPAGNSWADEPLALPKEVGLCPSGFYSPELNAHFVHVAGDSDDNGTMWAYRYKRAGKR